MKKNKINFVIPGMFKSGGMKIIFEYANRLHKKGYEVKLFNPIYYYNFYKDQFKIYYNLGRIKNTLRDVIFGVKMPENFYHHNFKIINVPLIIDAFVENADIVIATAWPTAYSVNNLSKSKGKKLYFIQGYETWNSNTVLVDNSYKLPLSRITISNYLKNIFEKKFDVSSEVIYNGIDFSKFDNTNKIFNNPKRISFIYNSLEIKNCELAIRTIIRIKEKYPNTEVVSFGYAEYDKLPGFVKYYNNPDEELIKKIYCSSDIFLFTSKEEGFGLPPAEAMACKCAVVTSKVGAVPEYSVNNISAIHINPDSSDELYYGICDLMENENKLKSISLEGYKTIRNFLNWDDSVKKFERILNNL